MSETQIVQRCSLPDVDVRHDFAIFSQPNYHLSAARGQLLLIRCGEGGQEAVVLQSQSEPQQTVCETTPPVLPHLQ
jgi:hypothetical protein